MNLLRAFLVGRLFLAALRPYDTLSVLRHPPLLSSLLVKHVERDTADLVSLLVCDQYDVVPVAQLRMICDQLPRDHIGRVHGLDVARQLDIALSRDRLIVRQIKVIELHHPARALRRALSRDALIIAL
ncbi:hypothetical protein [Bradyrhizobium sp. HKCCYLS20291]|uniref:hypothetical protein n=1 Tax=Bradyrhizobium sp. HKCCYLS20291 TaxID=3420766 RepID=UPI003EBB34ED